MIYLDPSLAQARVVVEGRAQVKDGDRVTAKADASARRPPGADGTRGGGFGRPL